MKAKYMEPSLELLYLINEASIATVSSGDFIDEEMGEQGEGDDF